MISNYSQIVNHSGSARSVQPVTIGSGVWMAPGCIVIQGVEIGENSVIGTGAVVTKSIPANCLAVGVPAKVVKRLKPGDDANNAE